MEDVLHEASLRFARIVAESDRLGISRTRLCRMVEARRPAKLTRSSSKRKLPIFVCLAVLVAIIYRSELYTWSGLTKLWLLWHRKDPLNEKCTVWMPDIVTSALRPPVNCDMCREIESIDRVANITPKQFEELYAFSGRPVVIEDAMTNWSAPKVFSFEFFKELYADSKTQENCQFFPYQTEFVSLAHVFEMSEERAKLSDGAKPWSNCDDRVGRVLRRHYDRPYFLPETSENKNVDWIFMGSPGYGAHMHVDNVNNPSWQAQLVGAKKWSLQPPPECIYECKSHEVVINTGEIFVLDTNSWYHATRIVSDGISITIGAEYD
ncbi:uncharacterized protein isoform X2 [Rhodnius prolixus]|uniref:uncharacterized protein isoform X2 n=1 Tax=Rhodnius prolixus TaxID=13249 RepID=UPI003D18952D